MAEESLSHLVTLHFGTLSSLAGDFPLLAQAEVTAGAVPHLPVVPDGATVQAVPLGRHTLLTALPGALHLLLPLKASSSSEQGSLKAPGTAEGAAGLSEVGDFSVPAHR